MTGRRASRWPTCRTCAATGPALRLAGDAGPAQRDPAVHDDHRRPARALAARPLAGPGRHPADHDPRLAGLFLEFERALRPLADPVASSGAGGDAFHPVVPSLPAYGFSGRPAASGQAGRPSALAGAMPHDRDRSRAASRPTSVSIMKPADARPSDRCPARDRDRYPARFCGQTVTITLSGGGTQGRPLPGVLVGRERRV
jgi:hypothetical protein